MALQTLAALRDAVTDVQQDHVRQLRSTAGVLVSPDAESDRPCPQCGGPMRVRKTVCRRGQTLQHGLFRVRETVWVCAKGCRKPGPPSAGAPGKPVAVTRRSAALAQLLLPRRSFGYDVMVFAGIARFVHHRQRREIQTALQTDYGIQASNGEISALARDFVAYLEALHEARAPALRAALERDGGWPMHIDATGEDGQGTLLVVYAGWRRWVLGSWKIPTERADAILPRLHSVADRFGPPCAIMRDLGRAMIDASLDFVAQRKIRIPVLGCHFHFLKDVGKDLLTEGHDQLLALFRRFKVRSRLRALARDLGRQFGSDLHTARSDLERWLAQGVDGHDLPPGQTGLAAVRAMTQWVLDYPRDGHDEGFPFDLPYLDLWRRCRTTLRAVEAFLRVPPDDSAVRKAIDRLHRILAPVRGQIPFQRHATVLEARTRLFTELRQALRLKVKPLPQVPSSPADSKSLNERRDIRQAVENLTRSLRDRRPQRGPAEQTRQAIDLILKHLDRHGPSLWGHAISLPQAAGGGIRLVDRTNLLLEGFFHAFKHGERRRSGRKVLTQDLEALPGAAILATNLIQPDYVAILCGTLDNLPSAFADLDADDRSRVLPLRQRASSCPWPDVASSSLPAVDRPLVRSEGLKDRVLAAARSRAPQHPSSKKRCTATVG